MKKEQIEIEYSLRSTSPNLIWRIISTEGGLQKWLADDVKAVEDKFFFTWGDEWRHHEKRCANKVECIRHSHIRLRWDDETDPDEAMNLYDEVEFHPNCSVQVLRDSMTGRESVGWWRNDE